MSTIPAYSKRQVMDWSLVLASQDIPATIIRSDENGWALLVDSRDYPRALEAIRLFRLENRSWGWRQPIPWSDEPFHWGGLVWCWVLAMVHWVSLADLPGFRQAARLDSVAALTGQWWRVFTAMLLHADLGHLLANLTIGFLLFGLAMARFGAGLALFAAYLAGAAGNLAGLMFYPRPYIGLGASGMVMGALGLTAAPALAGWNWRRQAIKQIARAAFAGLLLFVLLGVDPSSDVVAHLGGFLAGGILGTLLNGLPERVAQDNRVAAGVWLVFGGFVGWTTWLAFSAAGGVS